MPIVLRLFLAFALGLGLPACTSVRLTTEQRIEALQDQARETRARTELTAAQIAAAQAAGQRCTTVTVVDANARAGVPTEQRVVCATPGVTVPNEILLPPAAKPLEQRGFVRPYQHGVSEYERRFGVGNTLPPGYWGDGRYPRGGPCRDWFGHIISYGPCLFRKESADEPAVLDVPMSELSGSVTKAAEGAAWGLRSPPYTTMRLLLCNISPHHTVIYFKNERLVPHAH